MRKTGVALLLLAITLFSGGCAVQGERPDGRNTDAASVKLLFEADGVKVYRFSDCGAFHWFAVDGEGRVSHIE